MLHLVGQLFVLKVTVCTCMRFRTRIKIECDIVGVCWTQIVWCC